MSLQYSTIVRNAKLDAVETAIGINAVVKIRTGQAPIDCAAADTGDVLATINLPENWMEDASNGVKVKTDDWDPSPADSTGIAGHFRIYSSDGTTCHMQGSVGMVAGDMIVDNTSFAEGQSFAISVFTLSAGNA